MLRSLSTLLLAFVLTALAHAQVPEGTFAIRGARVLPVVGTELAAGTVLVRDGRIAAVGADVEIPPGVPVLDGEGLVLIPGLVDTRAHLGLRAMELEPDLAEGWVQRQAALRVVDALDPADVALRRAAAGGVTTAQLVPTDDGPLAAQTAYVKLFGRTASEMLTDLGPRTGGLSLTVDGARAALEFGEALEAAEEYRDAWQAHRERLAAGETSAPPARDLGLEPLVEVLERRRTVHVLARGSADASACIALSVEHGFELVLHRPPQQRALAAELLARGVSVSLQLVDSPSGPAADPTAAAALESIGVPFALHGAGSASDGRLLLSAGAVAVRGGASRAVALRALTLEGARMLRLDDRTGSIEPGKHADLVLLSGDPFSVYTRVLATWIEGRNVFDRARPADLRLATGGQPERMSARDRMPIAPQVVLERGTVVRPEAPGSRFAVEAEWLFTGVGPPISKGVVLIEDGRVSAVGAQGEVELAPDTPVFRAPAVTPGLIDAHSGAGLALHGDSNGTRAVDAFDPRDPRVALLLARGVTVVQAVPLGGSALVGQASILRTFGTNVDDVRVRRLSALVFDLAGDPNTTMVRAARIRAAFEGARAWLATPEGSREANAQNSLLVRVLSGELPAIFVADREAELLTSLRIAREFSLRCVLSQAAEGYLVAAELARAAAPVLVGPPLARFSDACAIHASLENATLLSEAGVAIAITSGPCPDERRTHVLVPEAAAAAVNGLGVVPALRAVTLDAARLLGIEAERGSLERGKAADLVLWDGDPLEATTRVEVVIGDGRVVHDRATVR